MMAMITSEQGKEELQLLRRVFNTPDGKKVLANIVVETGLFSTINPQDEQMIALRNYGLSILARMGILVDKNIDSIIDKMMELDYTGE
jgi:hypothetical protein